jgi:hypothetical protein
VRARTGNTYELSLSAASCSLRVVVRVVNRSRSDSGRASARARNCGRASVTARSRVLKIAAARVAKNADYHGRRLSIAGRPACLRAARVTYPVRLSRTFNGPRFRYLRVTAR